MNGYFGIGLYSPRVAARIARVRPRQFQAWAKAKLLKPTKVPIGDKRTESTYSYFDLLLIRLIVRLKAQGAKPKAIKTALDTVSLMSGGDPRAWMRATFVMDTGMIVVYLPDKPEWNPIAASKGPQKLAVVFFPELIEELKNDLVPPDRFHHIEVDPSILGGAPVIKGTRLSTRAIVQVEESGEDPKKAYPHLTEEEVREAKDYEGFLKAA